MLSSAGVLLVFCVNRRTSTTSCTPESPEAPDSITPLILRIEGAPPADESSSSVSLVKEIGQSGSSAVAYSIAAPKSNFPALAMLL